MLNAGRWQGWEGILRESKQPTHQLLLRPACIFKLLCAFFATHPNSAVCSEHKNKRHLTRSAAEGCTHVLAPYAGGSSVQSPTGHPWRLSPKSTGIHHLLVGVLRRLAGPVPGAGSPATTTSRLWPRAQGGAKPRMDQGFTLAWQQRKHGARLLAWRHAFKAISLLSLEAKVHMAVQGIRHSWQHLAGQSEHIRGDPSPLCARMMDG